VGLHTNLWHMENRRLDWLRKMRLVALVAGFCLLAISVRAQDPTPTPTPSDSEQFQALVNAQKLTNEFLLFGCGAFLVFVALNNVKP